MGFINLQSGTAGGGGATWGTIAGTLSNQTDLQNALNAKISNIGPQTITGDFTVDGKLTVTGIIDPTQIQFSSLVNTANVAKYEIGHDGGTVMYYNVPVGSTMDFRIGGVSKLNVNTSGFITLVGDPTTNLGAATKQYVDASVVGLLDDRGNFDASVNLYPSSGGSGTAGAILKGDIWYISVAGTMGANPVLVGYSVRALTNTPGQTDANWDILNVGLGYVPENVANKATTFGTLNNTLYPTTLAVSNFVVAATTVTAGEIAFGGAGNTLTSSASLLWDDATKNFTASGVIGISLVNSNNVFYVAQGNVGYWFTGAASTGLLSHQGFGIDMKTTEKYTMGAVGLGNNSYIEVNDTAQTTKVSNLSGVGTRMVTADATGTLGSAAIPLGTVTSVSGTANRITSTGGTTPVIDIDAAYVGQTSITTLGTITTGTVPNANLANSTISGVALGGSLFALTIGTGLSGTSYNGSAPITIAIDSSVVTLTGVQALSNKTGLISQWTNDSGYALDNTVVHLAGAENITGDKTFLTGTITTFNSGSQTNFNGSLVVTDSLFTIKNITDGTKQGNFFAGNISTATTIVYNLPTSPGTLVLSVNGNTANNAGDVTIAVGTGTVTSVSGTLNRITSTGGATPVIDISASYVGQTSITTLGTITTGTWNGATIGVPYGGTGNTTFTAYSVILAGTTPTGAFQNVSGVGTSGQVLTSAGAGLIPTWATASASVVTITDDTTTNAAMYPTWVTAATGSLPLKVSSTKFSFNPSLGSVTTAGDAYIHTLTIGLGNGSIANNTALGRNALAGANSGTGYNVAVGDEALIANTTGSESTAVGIWALRANTTGTQNAAFGGQALEAATTGGFNVGMGTLTLINVTTGTHNTALGYNTGGGITIGGSNTILGSRVNGLSASLSNNIIIADGAGTIRMQTASTGITTFGSDLVVNTITVGRGNNSVLNNTAIGFTALVANTTGTFNTSVGYQTMITNTTGTHNTAMGVYALYANTSGIQNTAVGMNSLGFNTTGSYNTASGYYSLNQNTTGYYNTAIGNNTLVLSTTADYNTALGYQSLYIATGAGNTSVGSLALSALTTGTYNTAIGYNTGIGLTTGSNNTLLGGNINIGNVSNNIVLADGAGTIRLHIDSNGNMGLNTSTFGTSAVGVFAIANGTAPTTSPANEIQAYVLAGVFYYRDEAGNIITI